MPILWYANRFVIILSVNTSNTSGILVSEFLFFPMSITFVFMRNFINLCEIYKSSIWIFLTVIWHPWFLSYCCFVLRFQLSHPGQTLRPHMQCTVSLQWVPFTKTVTWLVSRPPQTVRSIQPAQWHGGLSFSLFGWASLACQDGFLLSHFPSLYCIHYSLWIHVPQH